MSQRSLSIAANAQIKVELHANTLVSSVVRILQKSTDGNFIGNCKQLLQVANPDEAKTRLKQSIWDLLRRQQGIEMPGVATESAIPNHSTQNLEDDQAYLYSLTCSETPVGVASFNNLLTKSINKSFRLNRDYHPNLGTPSSFGSAEAAKNVLNDCFIEGDDDCSGIGNRSQNLRHPTPSRQFSLTESRCCSPDFSSTQIDQVDGDDNLDSFFRDPFSVVTAKGMEGIFDESIEVLRSYEPMEMESSRRFDNSWENLMLPNLKDNSISDPSIHLSPTGEGSDEFQDLSSSNLETMVEDAVDPDVTRSFMERPNDCTLPSFLGGIHSIPATLNQSGELLADIALQRLSLSLRQDSGQSYREFENCGSDSDDSIKVVFDLNEYASKGESFHRRTIPRPPSGSDERDIPLCSSPVSAAPPERVQFPDVIIDEQLVLNRNASFSQLETVIECAPTNLYDEEKNIGVCNVTLNNRNVEWINEVTPKSPVEGSRECSKQISESKFELRSQGSPHYGDTMYDSSASTCCDTQYDSSASTCSDKSESLLALLDNEDSYII